MGKVYQAAIVGCGQAGSTYDHKLRMDFALSHSGAYYLHPRTKLVAACDNNPERLSNFGRKWKVKNLYSSLTDLLQAQKNLNILSICSPTEEHLRQCATALEAKLPLVFCEKPLSYNIQEACNFLQAHEQRPVLLNYFRRFNGYFQDFRSRLIAGQFGQVQRVNFFYTKGLIHNATHFLDLINWFFGLPEKVRALNGMAKDAPDAPLDALISLPGDIPCYLQNCRVGPNVNIMEMDLFTDKMRIQFHKGGRAFKYYDLKADDIYRNRLYLEAGSPEQNTEIYNSFYFAVDNIVNFLDGSQTLKCTLGDGYNALLTASAIIDSARRGEAKEVFIQTHKAQNEQRISNFNKQPPSA